MMRGPASLHGGPKHVHMSKNKGADKRIGGSSMHPKYPNIFSPIKLGPVEFLSTGRVPPDGLARELERKVAQLFTIGEAWFWPDEPEMILLPADVPRTRL